MGCVINACEPVLDIQFKCKQKNQKFLIESLLTHGRIDLQSLATVLDVNIPTLSQTLAGKRFLEASASIRLVKLFLMMLGD